MVSTRPSPAPARGRIAYPTAATYIPGDADNSPTYHASEPLRKTISRDSQQERVQGLKTWWKGFRDKEEASASASASRNIVSDRKVFGVPLSVSIEYASVQVSTSGPDGSLYVWGVIPVVVAKCGSYLKESAVEVEGTFRISGSAKRMRDLQTLFDTAPKYGKNIDWKTLTFTPHDAATIFRRFLTQMPEPVIPHNSYDDFRNAITIHNEGQLSVTQTVAEYKHLIQSLPRINLYLLLYVLDLLSVFAKHSDRNLMTAPNLALIFQPGVLSHPSHAMRPREHVLSQQVLEFLIEHQDNFLIGMELTKSRRRREKGNSRQSPSPLQSPRRPSPPPLVRAESDLMLPSDSDDDMPAGGYYVVESKRPTSPISPTSPLASSLPSIDASFLLPPKPKPARALPKPSNDLMEASDSDEDAPPGGYEVRTGDPARARAALLARASTRTSSTSNASSLARRRTLPVKKHAPERRISAKEAP